MILKHVNAKWPSASQDYNHILLAITLLESFLLVKFIMLSKALGLFSGRFLGETWREGRLVLIRVSKGSHRAQLALQWQWVLPRELEGLDDGWSF